MQVFNRPGFVHQFTMGMDVAGREFLLFVVKGTFAFPDVDGRPAARADDQRALVMADEHTGAPGFSATLRESDFAFRKPRCDVVLQGAAHAPSGKPAARVRVGLRVGGWHKAFDVVGHRQWRVFGPGIVATDPYPFVRQPFGYDTAFGGTDRLDPEDPMPPAYMPNPHGLGFAGFRNQQRLSGQPLPNTEEIDTPVASPYEDYRPMAFGPVWRGRPDRLRWGGTYDRHWQDEVFPFLPADFDDRYHQQVGEDQQIDPPGDGTEVVLLNLTPRGREAFRLPRTGLPLRIFRGGLTAFDGTLRPDTLIFEPEARRLSLVWRVQVPIRRTILEFTDAWIGAPRRGMLRARATGKRYVARDRDFALPDAAGDAA